MESLLNPEIELEIIASVVQKPDQYRDLIELLEADLFTASGYKWIIKNLQAYIKRWGKVPSSDYYFQELNEVDNESEQIKLQEVLNTAVEYQPRVIEYAEEKYREYVGIRLIDRGIKEALQKNEASRNITTTINSLENTVKKVRSSLKSKIVGVDYGEDYPQREALRDYHRRNPGMIRTMKTGIHQLDRVVKMNQGTVTGFLGPFKRYKSIVLVHCGFAGLLQGYNVAHVVFENTIEQTTARYDARFTGLDYSKIKTGIRTEEEEIKAEVLMKRVQGWANRLKILKGIPKRTSVADVATELKRLEDKTGFVPEIEIWDYANLIKSSGKSQEERLQQEDVIWDLIARAQEYGRNKIEVTACQANMEGVNVDDLTNRMWAKSIGIPQALDSGIAINQNDKEWVEGIVRLSPLFVRDGAIDSESRHIVLNLELARMCLDRQTDELWSESVDNLTLPKLENDEECKKRDQTMYV